jgi:prevent-host-death family protein
MCYVRTISQRELRNDNADVIREVEAGESFTVTRRGVPVARLLPLGSGTDLGCVRPAARRRWSDHVRPTAAASTAEVLDDLRGDR